jgi:hypothetical protein
VGLKSLKSLNLTNGYPNKNNNKNNKVKSKPLELRSRVKILIVKYMYYYNVFLLQDESIKQETRFKQHMQGFFQDSVKRKTPRGDRARLPPFNKSQTDEENINDQTRFERGTTPGVAGVPHKALVSLKPAPRRSEVVALNTDQPKCDFRQHFKEFMSTTTNVKRARSFSQPRDKNNCQSDSEVDQVGSRRGLSRNDSSRTEGSVEKCVEDVAETEKRPTKRQSRQRVNPSPSPSESSSTVSTQASSSTEIRRTESQRSSSQSQAEEDVDKPVLLNEHSDNRINSESSYEYVTDSSSSLDVITKVTPEVTRKQSVSSVGSDKPPQPKHKPPGTDGFSTSSYYARVRSRATAEAIRQKVAAAEEPNNFEAADEAVPASAPNSGVVHRKFDNVRRQRSKTVDRDMMSTAAASTEASSEDPTDIEVEVIMTEPNLTRSYMLAVSPADNKIKIEETYEAVKTTSPNNLMATASTYSKRIEARTSSDSLRVEELVKEEKISRLSPFNRFRSSLVSGSSTGLTSTARRAEAARRDAAEAVCNGGRSRTESTSNSSDYRTSQEKRSRFFYRKSRTGPLPGETASGTTEECSVNLTSNHSTTTLSNVDLSASHSAAVMSSDHRNYCVRAKSEFNPRSTAVVSPTSTAMVTASTTTSSDYVPKNNYFLAAAKRWASYDKPSNNTPFNRDSWKRSHRKFNYSRFLNYTRESFV